MNITPVDPATTDPDQREARAALTANWGQVPNLGAVLALSLPLTKAVLSFDGALSKGSFRGGSPSSWLLQYRKKTGARTVWPRTPPPPARTECPPRTPPTPGSPAPQIRKRRPR